jgi:hypothetical protein
MDRRLGGPQNLSGCHGEEKILPLSELELRPLGHYTDYALPAPYAPIERYKYQISSWYFFQYFIYISLFISVFSGLRDGSFVTSMFILGLWYRVVWQMVTNISEENTTSFFMVEVSYAVKGPRYESVTKQGNGRQQSQ